MGIHGEGTVGFDKTRGQYFARVPIGRLSNGKTRYVKRYAPTHREALHLRRALLNERDHPTHGRIDTSLLEAEPLFTESVTFQAFAEHHLDGEARNEIREVTRRGYLYVLHLIVFPTFGNRQIGSISSLELSSFFVRERAGRSAAHLNHARAAMSRVFQAALNHQLITDNPIRRTRKQRANPSDPVHSQLPWDLEECKQALVVAVGTDMDLFVHLAILTGARLGELLGLKWSDIDEGARNLTIRRTLTEQRGSRMVDGQRTEPTFGPPKTAKSIRTLTFGTTLAASLERHREVQELQRATSPEDWVEHDCVFTSRFGTPVWPSNFTAKFRRFLRDNGLRHQNVHALRHAFAINGLALGIDLPSISRALGHASLQITLDIYAREATDLQNRATQGLGDYFAGA